MAEITYGNNEHATALDVALSIHADVESTIYDTEYPEHEWPNILLPEQIRLNGNPGASSVAYHTRDYQGAASFIGKGPNNDIPMVGMTMGAVDVPLAASAVGFRITSDEARAHRKGMNSDLVSDLGIAGGMAAANLQEKSIVFGNKDLNFKGWVNYPNVPRLNWTKRWAAMNPEEKVACLNHIISAMWEETKTLFVATDLYLPNVLFGDMSVTPMKIDGVGVGMTAMTFFETNNLAKKLKGNLRIHPSRYLGTAGADGQNRIIAVCRNVRNQVWDSPLEFYIDQPVPEPLSAAWYGEQKFSSYHVRQIGSMMYMDGI